LPPPAKDGSEVQQREMVEVKNLIHTRSKERYAQAVWDARHEDPTPFVAVIGPKFDLTRLPATARLLEDVLNDQTVATSAAKDFFKRKFPAAAEMPGDSYREWTCDEADRKPSTLPLRSYPSGHSTMAYTFGIVLAALIPEKSQAILGRSASYAYSREICGDHYHSDVQAGQVLGTTLGVLLLNNTALKPEIEASKAELRAAQITK
jgi:acid phosphatase (class A)